MSIIKNIMSNSGDSNGPKKSVAHKNCNICTESFVSGKDDFRIAQCARCVESGYVRNAESAEMWRKHFKNIKANTLGLDMNVLLEKMADQKERKMLLEGPSSVSRANASEGVRHFSEIQKDQHKFATSLEIVRSQVMEYLPNIVAELGLKDLDIELFADMIVPARLSTPIIETRTARSVIANIVCEEASRMGYLVNQLPRLGEIVGHGDTSIKAKASSNQTLDGGIQRVGATSELSRQLRKANPFAPEPMALEQADPVGELAQPDPSMLGGAADPSGAMGMDPSQSGGLTPNDMPAEVVGDVTRIPDEEGVPGSPMPGADPMLDPQSMGMPTMNEGIIPQSEDAFAPQGGQDDSGLGDGSIQRVQQSASPRVRVVKPQLEVKAKLNGLTMRNIVGHVVKNVPVQAIKLEPKARLILDNTPALNSVIASYTDGSEKAWQYYATDKGTIFTSAGSEFFAENPAHFVAFIGTDPSFVKWAFLPDELQSQEGDMPPANPAEIGLPNEPQQEMGHDPVELEADVAIGEGTPDDGSASINEREPNVLMPSPSNLLNSPSPSLLNDQDQIHHNEHSPIGNEHIDQLIQELLGDEATSMLPEVESMYPEHSPEEQMNHAIASAAMYLYGIYSFAAAPPAWAKVPGEEHGAYVDRINKQFPGAQRQFKNHILSGGGDPNMGLEDFLSQNMGGGGQSTQLPGSGLSAPSNSDAAIQSEIVGQNPQVPEHAVVRQKSPEGQVIDTPAAKIRNQQYTQQLQNPPTPAPKGPMSLSNFSDKELPGMELPEEDLSAVAGIKDMFNEYVINPIKDTVEDVKNDMNWHKMVNQIPQAKENQIPLGHPSSPMNMGIPPSNKGIPPSNKGIPPSNMGIPPSNMGIPPSNKGIPPMPPHIGSLIQLAEDMGDMKEDEFMNEGASAMVEAGYSDAEIMTVYALKYSAEADELAEGWKDGEKKDNEVNEAKLKHKAEDSSPVFGDYSAVENVVKEEKVTEESKRGLHNADPNADDMPDLTK